MLNKKLFNVSLLYYLPFIGLCLIGIIVGTFCDLNISSAIVNQNSAFGRFIESFGMVVAYFLINASGVIVFKFLLNSKNKWLFVLANVYLILTYIASAYYIHNGFVNSKEVNVTYGFAYSKVISYVIAFIISSIYTAISFFLIKKVDKDLLIIALIFVIALILQVLIINLLKKLNCRPRYRNMLGADYLPWYSFHPFSQSSDLYKSWPSGHTATATISLLFPLLFINHSKIKPFIIMIISYSYILLIAFYRVYYGAHFLSDVSFGGLISALICLLVIFIGNRISTSLKRKTNEVEFKESN